MSTKHETFKLMLVDGAIVELRVIARIGDFVIHPPWQDPKSRKMAVVTHEPTGYRVIYTWSKIVRAFVKGAKSGKTLARVSPAARAYAANPDTYSLDPKSPAGRAWRALKRYERILDNRIEL